MRRALAAALALGLALAGAALAGPAPPDTRRVTDMRGRLVTLPAAPTRIVSLVPSATEILFALGADDRIVGVTDFCDFPPAARAKPRVGGMLAPSLEAVVALRPDLVVATDAGTRRETVARLAELGLPVYLVGARRVAEAFEVIDRLGALTGRAEAAAALRARLAQRVQEIARAVADRPRPRVLYVLWPEPLLVPGRQAIVTELIALAGGASVTADEPGDYPRLSLEAVVARAPEVIVLARHGAAAPPLARDPWDRLRSVPAVRAGRVHGIDGDLVHRYGPRLVDGLLELARTFHPEVFP